MASNYGTRSNASGPSTNKVKIDMSNKIHLLEDEKAPLATFLYGIPSEPAHQQTFMWMTDQINPKYDTLNAALNGTTLVPATADFVKINDIVKVPSTGETMLVTARGSSTSFTVTRTWGAVAQDDTKTTGEPILNLGPAFAPGSRVVVSASDDTPISVTQTELEVTNYTQIWRHIKAITRTLAESDNYGDPERVYQQRKMALEHIRDQNLDAYHMEKNISSGRATSMGILEHIPSANVDTTATLTEAAWQNFMRTAGRYGRNSLSGGGTEKYAFMSYKLAGIISQFASVNQRLSPGDTSYGVRLMRYETPGLAINLVTDFALDDNATYRKLCVIVDKSECKRRVLHETEMQLGMQYEDLDGFWDGMLTEAGWEWGNGQRHSALNSVTA